MASSYRLGFLFIVLILVGCARPPISKRTAPVLASGSVGLWQVVVDTARATLTYGPAPTYVLCIPRRSNGFWYWRQDTTTLTVYTRGLTISSDPCEPYTEEYAGTLTDSIFAYPEPESMQYTWTGNPFTISFANGTTLLIDRFVPEVTALRPDSSRRTFPVSFPTGPGRYVTPQQFGGWTLYRNFSDELFIWFGESAEYAIHLRPDVLHWSYRRPARQASAEGTHQHVMVLPTGSLLTLATDFVFKPWQTVTTKAKPQSCNMAFKITGRQGTTTIACTEGHLSINQPNGAVITIDLAQPIVQYLTPAGSFVSLLNE